MKASIFVSFKKPLFVHGLGLAIAASFLAATSAAAQVTFCGDIGARYDGCGTAVNKNSGCSRAGKETFLCSSSSPRKISAGFGAAVAKQPATQPSKQTAPANKASSTPKRAKAPAPAPKPVATQDSRCRNYEASGLEPVRDSSSCSDGSTPISCPLSNPPFILCPQAKTAEMREGTPEYTGGGPLKTTEETAEQDPTFKSNFGDPETIKKIQDQKNPKPSLLGGSNLEPIPEADQPDLEKISQNSFDKAMADRKTPAPSLLNKDGTGVNTDYDGTAPSFDVDAISKKSYDNVTAARKTPKPTFLNADGTGVRTDYDERTPPAPDPKAAGTGSPDAVNQKSAEQKPAEKKNEKAVASTNDDFCANTMKIDGSMECNSTRDQISGIRAAGEILSKGAEKSLALVGAAQTAKAQSSGKLSDGVKAQGKAQETSAKGEMTVGAMNFVAGLYQEFVLRKKHTGNRDTLHNEVTNAQIDVKPMGAPGSAAQAYTADATNDASGRASNALDAVGRDYVASSQEAARKSAILKVQTLAAQAKNEQSKVADEARAGAIFSGTVGMGQLIQGMANLKAAKITQQAANKLESTTTVPTFNLTGDEFVARQPQSIGAAGGDPGQSAATEDDEVAMNDQNLGDPFGGPFDSAPKDPAPGADPFKSASIPPSQGGGGPGGGPGGSTSVASDGDSEAAPKMADSEKVQYQGAGAAPTQAGRGGAKAGGDGMDLSKLFAGLLPKTEEEEKMDQSILDFGGRRGPASENSILGRDSKSLFTRISEVNADKFKHGYLR